MIYLGRTPKEKASLVAEYAKKHDLKKVVVCGPAKFDFDLDVGQVPVQFVDWPEIIMYRTFYPLLEEIDQRTLVICNEPLRTSNRHDLTLNCIRHYLAQAGHVLVFSWLPMITSPEDFMILFDFDTGSKWKREKLSAELLMECQLNVVRRTPSFSSIGFVATEKTKAKYEAEKAKLAEQVEGGKDPSILPRQLHMIAGKERLEFVEPSQMYLGRNNRFKMPNLIPYKSDSYPSDLYIIFEFPHAVRDLADVSAINGQTSFNALMSDLPADQFYIKQFSDWSKEVAGAYANLSA